MIDRARSRNPEQCVEVLPDDRHRCLKDLAASNPIGANKLIDKLTAVALDSYDARGRFETRSRRSNPRRALALLDMLDRAE